MKGAVAFDFSGRVAFVSGGASGIGLAIARRLADAGATVAIADRDGDGAARAAAALGNDATGHRVDVADEQAVAGLFARIADTLGPVTLAANCAGIGGTGGPLADGDLD